MKYKMLILVTLGVMLMASKCDTDDGGSRRCPQFGQPAPHYCPDNSLGQFVPAPDTGHPRGDNTEGNGTRAIEG